MPSGPVTESESRFDSKLSTLSEEKDTESRDSFVRLGKVGRESDGFRTQDFDGNTELRHSAFSRAVSAVQPFEVTEGMEGEHTPETDLNRGHQDLEEGERFENSALRLERFCEPSINFLIPLDKLIECFSLVNVESFKFLQSEVRDAI